MEVNKYNLLLSAILYCEQLNFMELPEAGLRHFGVWSRHNIFAMKPWFGAKRETYASVKGSGRDDEAVQHRLDLGHEVRDGRLLRL
jgi:hypothetical protein